MAYIEIFELNQHSTKDDVQNCFNWIEQNFNESKFVSISIIIKRTKNQHIYVEELNEEQDEQINGKQKKNNLSLTKVTQNHQEQQMEQKLTQKKVEAESIVISQSQRNIKKINENGSQNEEGNKLDNQLKDLLQLVKQAESLTSSRTYDSAIEQYNKIASVCKQLTEQQEEENLIAFHNSRQRDKPNQQEDEKDQGRDQRYLQILQIQLTNYIKLGRCQLIQKKNDGAIHYFEQGAEFYRRVKSKKLIGQKFNQDVYVDIMLPPQTLQELFSSLGDTYYNQKNYEKSIENFQNALQIIDRYQDQEQEAPKLRGNIYNFLGLAYYCLGNISKAIDSFNQSLQICLQLNGENDIQVANRMNNLAEAFRNDKQYEKALQYFHRSLEIKKKGDSSQKGIQGLGKTCLNIGITYQDTKDFSKAIEYYIEAVNYYKQYYSDHYKDEGGTILSVLYTSLAECYKEVKDFSEAAKYYEKVYEINKSMYGLKNKQTINCANSLATLLFKLQLFEKSVELFEQILSFQKQYHGEQSIQVVQTLINMGTIFCKMKKYQLGIEKIDMALIILESNPNSDQATIEQTKQSKLHYEKKLQLLEGNINSEQGIEKQQKQQNEKKLQQVKQNKKDLKVEEL